MTPSRNTKLVSEMGLAPPLESAFRHQHFGSKHETIMKKTLLLCFIHGFKGDDNTFGGFPEHLRALVSHGLPKVEVRAIVYPQFETRGNLETCVSRFRDW